MRAFNPSLTFNYPFFLLSSTLRFSFAVLCTTNFSRFWFFWMASFCTLVVHKYHPRIYSARCKASCGPSLQGRWWLPWWQPSAWIASWQSPSKSMSLRFAWACSVLCWLSSMQAGRGRGGHQTGRPSCDVLDAGSGRSSAGGWYYEKLLISCFMTSGTLWEVGHRSVLKIKRIESKLYRLTSHNDMANNIKLCS